jgi:hypothetical protein
MTDEKLPQARDAKGRLTTGNRGRPRGSPDTKVRPRKGYNDKLSVETRRQIGGSVVALAKSASENLPDVLEFLAAEAKVSARAAEAYIRAVSPGAPKVAYAPEIAHLRPEDRIPAIGALAATAKLDLDAAAALVKMAEAEIRWSVIGPIRRCLDQLDRANRQGSADEVRIALVQLAERVRELSGTIIEEREVIDG